MNSVYLVSFMLSAVVIMADPVRRKLAIELNPNCDLDVCKSSNFTVIHVCSKATGNWTDSSVPDEIHYIWDFTGKPSVLIAVTPPKTELRIDWEKFLDDTKSISFSQSPKFYYGVVIQKLWEYNDRDDVGIFDVKNNSDLIEYDMRNVAWERTFLHNDDDLAEVVVQSVGYDFEDSSSPLGITLKLTTFAVEGHDLKVPHLLHNDKTTQFDFVLENMKVQKNFSCSRFAFGLTMFSSEPKTGNFSLSVHRSLDDEFTPGTFEIINVESPLSLNKSEGGFLQYRPVSYFSSVREVSASTEVYQGSPAYVGDALDTLNYTTIYLMEEYKVNEILVQNLNVSIGTSADGCYKKYNYTTFTFIAAYGYPLPEKLSLFIVVVATIGLGVPILLMVGGGCFLCIKKARS